jgi:hypothetical protein
MDINNVEKCRVIAGYFDCHADSAVGCGAHCLIEHIQGSLEATGCRQRASACTVLPLLPRSLILNETTKH